VPDVSDFRWWCPYLQICDVKSLITKVHKTELKERFVRSDSHSLLVSPFFIFADLSGVSPPHRFRLCSSCL